MYKIHFTWKPVYFQNISWNEEQIVVVYMQFRQNARNYFVEPRNILELRQM